MRKNLHQWPEDQESFHIFGTLELISDGLHADT